MGKLIDGKWITASIITSNKQGAFDRPPRTFRNTISEEHPIFKPEKDRYHLIVSYACPWAHRTLIVRQLKDLAPYISVEVVHPDLNDSGWELNHNIYGLKYLYEIYQKAQADISSTVTVPVLWDKKTETIVNNESSEIIQILNTAFNDLTGNHNDYYPAELRSEIDTWNETIYHAINNGVYKCGFAKHQVPYDTAVDALFSALDTVENHLEGRSFLVGEQLTEADVRLITTLLRFDAVYYVHFKCCIKKIGDYPNLKRYTQTLFKLDAVKTTTNFEHIIRHYYYSHTNINPHRIIPKINVDYLGLSYGGSC